MGDNVLIRKTSVQADFNDKTQPFNKSFNPSCSSGGNGN